jgi:hypothetical protein
MKYPQLLIAASLASGIYAMPVNEQDALNKRQISGTTFPLTPSEILQQVQVENQIQSLTSQIIQLQKQLITIGNATSGTSGTNSAVNCNCNCTGKCTGKCTPNTTGTTGNHPTTPL